MTLLNEQSKWSQNTPVKWHKVKNSARSGCSASKTAERATLCSQKLHKRDMPCTFITWTDRLSFCRCSLIRNSLGNWVQPIWSNGDCEVPVPYHMSIIHIIWQSLINNLICYDLSLLKYFATKVDAEFCFFLQKIYKFCIKIKNMHFCGASKSPPNWLKIYMRIIYIYEKRGMGCRTKISNVGIFGQP